MGLQPALRVKSSEHCVLGGYLPQSPAEFLRLKTGLASPLEAGEPELETTLLEAIRGRAQFGNSLPDLMEHRDREWRRLLALAAELEPERRLWAEQTLDASLRGHRHLHQPFMASMAKETNSPDSRFGEALSNGFRLFGSPDDSQWWGRGRAGAKCTVSAEKLFQEAAVRRANGDVPLADQNLRCLWTDLEAEVAEGLWTEP